MSSCSWTLQDFHVWGLKSRSTNAQCAERHSHTLLVTRPHETLMFFVAGLFKSASPTSDSPPPKLLKCRAAQKIQNRRHCSAFSSTEKLSLLTFLLFLFLNEQRANRFAFEHETIMFKTKIQKTILAPKF